LATAWVAATGSLRRDATRCGTADALIATYSGGRNDTNVTTAASHETKTDSKNQQLE
jgi:hypothetical protein